MTTATLNQRIPHSPVGMKPKDYYESKQISSESSAKIFQEVSVVKQLNKAKFPVYLVNSKINNQNYAMKVFSFDNDQPHAYYKNEVRFSNLNHPNVVRNFYFEHERKTKCKGVVSKVSYKIMEYAPHGDFFDLVTKYGQKLNEKAIRTFFKQLIAGLEYLHMKGVSHLDLKLDNLLLGKDMDLKIADFDLSHIIGDARIISKGTKFYRPLELMQAKCKNTRAADIYSAGIVLFTLKTQGIMPHAETSLVGGVNFSDLLHNNDPQFWTEHCKAQGKPSDFFDEDFKELFMSMIQLNPERRATIDMIKESKWYNGPCYTPEELKVRMEKIIVSQK